MSLTEQEFQKLQKFIDDRLSNKKRIKILEAGCGSATYLKFKPESYFVGIDISETQLNKNKILDEKILGDIQTFPLPDNEFDAVICWNVLEHVNDPGAALRNFHVAMKPEGILILSLPNIYSLKGLITKFTPHWFHVFFYRCCYKEKDAGKIGKAPFKTFMRKAISPAAISRFAEAKGMSVDYLAYYDVRGLLKMKNQILYKIYAILDQTARYLSLDKLGDSEYYIVLQKHECLATS